MPVGPDDQRRQADTLRVLIADGNAAARQRICELVAAAGGRQTVVGCADGPSMLAALREGGADLVLLDIQLPELDAFDLISRMGSRMPPVILMAAEAGHAVRAFEVSVLDFLLKPFSDERLAVALARGRERVCMLDARALGLADLLGHLRRPPSVRFPEAFAVKTGDQYIVVRARDISWIEAHGNYAKLHMPKRSRLLGKSLATLEKEVLDPERFVRVHRSAIVNITKVVGMKPHANGDATLLLDDGTQVDCSRSHRAQLRDWLYFTT